MCLTTLLTTSAKIYFVIGGPPDFNPLVPAGMGTFCKLCTVARSLCWQGIVSCWLRSSLALQPRSSSFVMPGKSPDVKALRLRSRTEGGRPWQQGLPPLNIWLSGYELLTFIRICSSLLCHKRVCTWWWSPPKTWEFIKHCQIILSVFWGYVIKQPFFIKKSLITGDYPLEITG